MKAELVAVGSELLRFGFRDTNSEWLTERLNRIGFEVVARTIVDDHVERIASALQAAIDRAGTVIVTGGLGPTQDDRTREAVARTLGRTLERDPEQIAVLQERARRVGLSFTADHERQADLPAGAVWIPNPVGAAAGILFEEGNVALAVLPGVPGEMRAMAEATLLPRLRSRGSGRLAVRKLLVAGRSESAVDRKIRELYGRADLDVTVLAGVGAVTIQLRADAADATTAEGIVTAAAARAHALLGEDLFGQDEDTLPAVVGKMLADRGLFCATAESCTAGGIAAAITEVAGSSAWFRGGLVVYADELKPKLAGVSETTLRVHGAVSEEVARELAAGVRVRLDADIGVGITGIAGPGGGTPDKPVGLVHLAIDRDGDCRHWELQLSGGRALVRRRTVAVALDRLRRVLLQAGPRA